MVNQSKLTEVIAAYKKYFPQHWEDEKYKWEAVKCFLDHWDINAPDFKTMLEAALDKTSNLLASGYFYAKAMIVSFAEEDPEATRAAFMSLFDETKDIEERVETFQVFADDRKDNHNSGWKNHYQNTNAISTYLWLRYPDKYYIYKYSEYLSVSNTLASDFKPKRTSEAKYMVGGYGMYDEICATLKKDEELNKMFRSALTSSCYPDPELHTLTIDVGFFISRFFSEENKFTNNDEWWPSHEEYDPELSVNDWVDLLSDRDVFTQNSLKIVKRFKEYGGKATCAQLAEKYGGTAGFYNMGSQHLAKRIVAKKDCPLTPAKDDFKDGRWWPVLYVGRRADKNEQGNYVWKLRDELSEALDLIDIDDIQLYETESLTKGSCNYWWLNASPKIWSFSEIAVGEEQSYSLYNDNGNKRHIFQNFLDAKNGDIIICYEANPVKQIVALARISKENDGKYICFEKTEGLAVPIDYAELKGVPELADMQFFVNPNGSLFKLTSEEFELIIDIIREANPLNNIPEVEAYTKKDFLNQVYMTEDRFDTLVGLLKNKKNIILQGAPGVGKTFTAKRLAYAIMGKKDDSRIEFIQFHQNYSYEDFIMGYKPADDSFKLTNGIFYRFCQTAANHPDEDYFFIIDEINRGNLSKIFGELLMLIEKDYRGTKATLAYSGALFSVPQNLYIIGMMNTADRSLALIDYALRRRFSFFEMEPGFGSEGFKKYQSNLNNETFDTLIERVKDLNKEIYLDDSLGAGFRIGHSYFCGQTECTDEWMREVVYYDLLPMLQEYWFDDKQKLQKWENILMGVFND